MTSFPLVSVITPVFNSARYLPETYESLLAQSYNNWEWVVTDDCSSDDSWKILSDISKSDPRVKVHRNGVNSGAAVSRNVAIDKSVGDFIAFLDSDDYWFPDKLLRQIEFMGDGIDFSFTAYEIMNDSGQSLGKVVDGNRFAAFGYKDMLLKSATIGCSTVILRRSAFSDISMPLIRTGQDYALWLKLLKTGTCAHLFSRVLTRYRISPNSISRNKLKKAKRQWSIYRDLEGLSLLNSVYCFLFYAWRAVFKA